MSIEIEINRSIEIDSGKFKTGPKKLFNMKQKKEKRKGGVLRNYGQH